MIKHIDVSLIRQDGGTQARAGMDAEAVEEYALAMANDEDFPPVVVFQEGNAYWLGDGFHRVSAHIKAFGIAPISADVREGGLREARLFAIGANSAHGVRRSTADKRMAVSLLLQDPEWSQWSDRQIAKHCSVSQPFVSGLRKPKVAPATTPKGDNVITHEQNNHISIQEQIQEMEREAPDKVCAEHRAPSPEDINQQRPKAMPEPETLEDVAALKAQVVELKAQVEDLEGKLAEAGFQVQELHEENESLHRILDAEDLLGTFKKEVLSAQERARVAESQRNGVMVENRDLAERLKSAMRKIDRLQKKPPEEAAS